MTTYSTCVSGTEIWCGHCCCCCCLCVVSITMTFNLRLKGWDNISINTFVSGSSHNAWNVNYHQQLIYAAKGSTVVIPCSFYFPIGRKVTGVMWGSERHDFYNGPFIFDSREQMNPSSRFQYDGDQQQNCTLKIHKVEQNDAGQYAFRFITDTPQGKFTGLPGSTLNVFGEFNFSVT